MRNYRSLDPCPTLPFINTPPPLSEQHCVLFPSNLFWHFSVALAVGGRGRGMDKNRNGLPLTVPQAHCWGSWVFNSGGGGIDRAPQNLGSGGHQEKGSIDRAINHELWCRRRRIFFWALKMVKFFFTKYTANDDFSEPPQRADSKNAIFSFSRIFLGGQGHLRAPGVSLGRSR